MIPETSTSAPNQARPVGICGNCYVTWKAKRPRPSAVEGIGDDTLAALREEDLL